MRSDDSTHPTLIQLSNSSTNASSPFASHAPAVMEALAVKAKIGNLTAAALLLRYQAALSGKGRASGVSGAPLPPDPARAERDAEILRLSREGLTQREIATRMGVSQPTAGRALKKLGTSHTSVYRALKRVRREEER